LEKIVKDFRYQFRIAKPSKTKVFPGAINFLEEARKIGVRTSTATTRPTEMAKFQINGLGIAEYFDLIQGTDDFPPKPSPDVIFKARDLLGVSKVFMFGDRMEDMEAAVSAGAIAIGLAQSSHDKNLLSIFGAKEVYASFLDVLDPEILINKYI
jgi:HAD superfamily hydrolase (TIGR01549 family)